MEITFYTSQILNGLCYLHSSQIAHLDLKPANVVLTENKKIAKICDMDSSRRIWSDKSSHSDVSRYLGTFRFTSPEYLKHDRNAKPIGRATDIWSLGCVVLYMLGKGDFHIIDQDGKRVSVEDYLQERYFSSLVMNGRIPDIPARISANMRSFISNCLKSKPEERTSGASLLDHQVFKSVSDSNSNSDFEGKDMLRVGDEEWIAAPRFGYPDVWNPRFDFLVMQKKRSRKIAIWHCPPVKGSAWNIFGTDLTNLVMQKKTEFKSSLPELTHYQWSNDGQRLCTAGGRVKPRPVLFVVNWSNS